MKKHKKIILLGSLAFLVILAATLGAFLGNGRAASAGVEAGMQDELQAQGLRVATVSQDAAADTLNVVINSKTGGSPEDAWASTIVQREAGFLAESGALAAGSVAVTIIDEQGRTMYQWSGPVDAQPRPAGKTVNPAALDSLRPDLADEAQKQGVTLQNLSISSDESQGVVLEAEVTLTASTGDARDNEIRWATIELLGELRDYTDGSGTFAVDLYKISVDDARGAPLVQYVVDPTAKTVHAWMAPGVSPVWATGRPSPGPAAVSTAP
jgi:hypothetical protein